MRYHQQLNPKIWNEDNTLKEEVNDKLLEIANAFMEFLEVPEDAIEDILIVGSSANYNYTDFSDIDVHLIVDYDKVHEDCPLVQGYLWAFKTIFNDEHDITIYDIPVEMYAEDSNTPRISNGVYSLMTNEWLSEPEKIEITVDDNAVKKKYEELKETIDKVDDSEKAVKLLRKIYDMRKAGLQEEGEFSIENLVFKELRNNKDIDKLWTLKKKDIDDKLSLNEKFSTTNTDMTSYNDSLKYNLYQRETKGRFSEVVLMSPDEYIDLCHYGFFNTGYTKGIYSKDKMLSDRSKDRELIEKLKDLINSDEELAMPVLEFGDVNTDNFYFYQEGLHRAIAAKELGLKEIPVLLMFSGRKGLKALRKFIKEFNFKQLTDNWTDYEWQNEYVDNASEIYECRINEMSLEQQIRYYEDKDDTYNNKLINFGKPSELLQDFGVPDKDIFMSVGKYKCSIGKSIIKHHSHNVSKETMLDLSSYLEDPKYILYPKKESLKSRRYVLILDAKDNDNLDIIAVIDYDWQGNRLTILNSVYGKENIQNFINSSEIVYKKGQ